MQIILSYISTFKQFVFTFVTCTYIYDKTKNDNEF
jgi:hypothetical protein